MSALFQKKKKTEQKSWLNDGWSRPGWTGSDICRTRFGRKFRIREHKVLPPGRALSDHGLLYTHLYIEGHGPIDKQNGRYGATPVTRSSLFCWFWNTTHCGTNGPLIPCRVIRQNFVGNWNWGSILTGGRDKTISHFGTWFQRCRWPWKPLEYPPVRSQGFTISFRDAILVK